MERKEPWKRRLLSSFCATRHGICSLVATLRPAREKRSLCEQHSFCPNGGPRCFDYAAAIGLIASRFIFGFANLGGIAVFPPIVLGAGLFLYSLLTVCELGISGVKFIPMSVHLSVDFVASAFSARGTVSVRLQESGTERLIAPGYCGHLRHPSRTGFENGPQVNATSLTAAA